MLMGFLVIPPLKCIFWLDQAGYMPILHNQSQFIL